MPEHLDMFFPSEWGRVRSPGLRVQGFYCREWECLKDYCTGPHSGQPVRDTEFAEDNRAGEVQYSRYVIVSLGVVNLTAPLCTALTWCGILALRKQLLG
jgi:hypothetical protein